MKNKDKLSAWLFLLPALLFLAITALFPLAHSLYLSFFRLKINLPNQKMLFVGLENYLKLFSDDLLRTSTFNTLFFAIISVLCETLLGIAVAMVLCSNKLWAKVTTSIFIVPMIMAPVAIGTLWRMMLDASTGVINYFINGLGFESISFLSNPKTAMISVIFVNIWQLTPWVTIIVAAALKNLSEEVLQAAIVDGASSLQIFTKIVLPLIRPVMIIILMIRFIDAFKVFDTVYVMTGGGPGSATEMLPNYIYKQGLRYFDAGYAASLAIMFVIVMTFCSILFLKWRKKEQENL
jgi:ABC superfamily ATP binding cassette transporter, membrane protein